VPRGAAGWAEVPTDGVRSPRGLEAPWPRAGFYDAVAWPPAKIAAAPPPRAAAAARLRAALSGAVARRVAGHDDVAVLFSGGLDSAVLARLAHDHVGARARIDLVNVAFGENGRAEADAAPDRAAGRATARELRAACPGREFRLIEVSVSAADLARDARTIAALAAPCGDHMSFNLAAALFFGAAGAGVLRDEDAGDGDGDDDGLRYGARPPPPAAPAPPAAARPCAAPGCAYEAHARCAAAQCGVCCRRRCRADGSTCRAHPPRRTREEKAAAARPPAPPPRAPSPPRGPAATSRARCLLLGMGADELLAGYARHRTAYARGGAPALAAELDGDLVRLASRNLGRDDRVVSHHGREARFPYLDEAVLAVVRGELGPAVADLDEPPGVGAKRVLRDVAADLGLPRVATLVKRALQFGTRIAPFSNRLCFGSNRKGDGTAAFDVDLLLSRIEGVGVS